MGMALFAIATSDLLQDYPVTGSDNSTDLALNGTTFLGKFTHYLSALDFCNIQVWNIEVFKIVTR